LVGVVGPGGIVKKQVITIAAKSGDNYVVTDGLTPGAVIVKTGLDKLKDGAVIKPLSAAPPAVASLPVKDVHK